MGLWELNCAFPHYYATMGLTKDAIRLGRRWMWNQDPDPESHFNQPKSAIIAASEHVPAAHEYNCTYR